MASVHLARVDDPDGFDGVVAIKTIHEHLAQHSEFVDMFLDEARLVSLLDHPNVCRVYDSGEQDGTYWLAMEYLIGEALDEVVEAVIARRHRDELRRLPYYAAAIAANACDGLHAAHELRDRDGTWLKVIHRDVSPQNLFLTYDGSVKIVDFGLAKAARRISQTTAGTVKGKLAYLAPETILRRPLDRRVDVWAMGVCLWEMLTLQRLFKRETDLETVMAVRDAPIPPPSKHAWWVPPEIDDIVLRALSRDPEQRYATARDMARDLRSFLIESRFIVDKSELARWMAEMFGQRRRYRLRLIEEAVGEPLFDDHVEAMSYTSPPVDAVRSTRPSAIPRLRASADDLAYQRPRRRRRWPAGLALAAAALIAAFTVWPVVQSKASGGPSVEPAATEIADAAGR